MDHNETSTFTPFDYMTQTRELQMLKTMLPYMKDTQKKQFAIDKIYGAAKHRPGVLTGRQGDVHVLRR